MLDTKQTISDTIAMAEKESSSKGFITPKRLIVGVLGILLIAAIVGCAYLFRQYQKSQQLLQNPSLAAKQQTDALLSQVGSLIELPKNETPQIATVSDVTKLQGQPFFANAQNGDKVLIYTGAKEAILYRPSTNKIIAVAPVNVNPTPTLSPTPTSTAKRVVPKVTVTH